jgi:hypothetical protein
MAKGLKMSEEKVVGDFVSDPELFDKLSVPSENKEAASKIGDAFYKEVCALREKYNVPEMVIAFGSNFKDDDGQVKQLQQIGYRGGATTDQLIMRLTIMTRFGSLFNAMIREAAAFLNNQ